MTFSISIACLNLAILTFLLEFHVYLLQFFFYCMFKSCNSDFFIRIACLNLVILAFFIRTACPYPLILAFLLELYVYILQF